MKPALSVKKLCKTYSNGKVALNNVSFDLSFGKFVVIMGPNGAGKSTLIHLITKVLKPTSGDVTTNGTKANEIAWVSQFTSIDWYLNVLDNVRLGARLGSLSGSNAEEESKKALTLLGLKDKINMYPDELSGGEQKRMQVARALAQNPKILILDEPTTGLDPIASQSLMMKLKQLTLQNCLIIIASHDLTLMEDFTDTIIVIDQGSLIMCKEKSCLSLSIKDTFLSLFNTEGIHV
jgi:ABC-type multidrug transport system ATPase subunit